MVQIWGFRVALLTAAVIILNGPLPEQSASDATGLRFRNVAITAGLRFTHRDSPTGSKYFVDSAPGGLAVFDYNGDGRPDIFFTNGAATPSLQKTFPTYANRLYRNDGHMKFTDVIEAAGVRRLGDAMGAAAAEYDNGGHGELFVA